MLIADTLYVKPFLVDKVMWATRADEAEQDNADEADNSSAVVSVGKATRHRSAALRMELVSRTTPSRMERPKLETCEDMKLRYG